MIKIWARDLRGKALESPAGQRFRQKYELAKMSSSDVKVERTEVMKDLIRLVPTVFTPKTVKPSSKKRDEPMVKSF